MPEVTYERRGAAGVLTIDRPDRRNAVDPATADQLLEAYREFEGDDEARVLILTGAGDAAFCAGADLKSVAAAMDDQGIAEQWLKPRPHGPLGFTRITSPKPTIAAISGYALAGGLELALWCDLRIGTETAKLGFPERRWGVPLIDGGTQRLPRVVGMGRALDLIITGRIVEAEEALAMGLLTEVVAAGQAPRSCAGDGGGPGPVPAGDDARRPPLGAGGILALTGRGTRPRGRDRRSDERRRRPGRGPLRRR